MMRVSSLHNVDCEYAAVACGKCHAFRCKGKDSSYESQGGKQPSKIHRLVRLPRMPSKSLFLSSLGFDIATVRSKM
jgi:hypothetical protein